MPALLRRSKALVAEVTLALDANPGRVREHAERDGERDARRPQQRKHLLLQAFANQVRPGLTVVVVLILRVQLDPEALVGLLVAPPDDAGAVELEDPGAE